jgi:nitrogen fixation/metabolism regulation signal transduction histidine kinase
MVGWLVSRGGPLADAMMEDLLPAAAGQSVGELSAQVIAALAAGRPNDALQAATRMPPPSADDLIRRILTIFPDPQSAAAAIDAIADPVAAQRARAWLDCLAPGAKSPQ